MKPSTPRLAIVLMVCALLSDAAMAQPPKLGARQPSITDRSLTWPAGSQWKRLLLLEDYNTRVVLLGTTLLGCTAGLIGSFTLLRKRALVGDALSHATLPGIGLAFIATTYLGGQGKSLVVLLIGATISGLLGVATILLIRNLTRLKEDTALGVVLSVFFGAGVAILGIAQQMKDGHAAGLEGFIYGKTASMSASDTWLIGGAALTCAVVCLLLFKEFKLLCFDEGFAGSHGLPVARLDRMLMALVVIITIVGLQAVGLILILALLVIPASAARFWTNSLWSMFLISGVLGALGGLTGAATSALFSNLPSGATIVLVCTLFFLFSMVFGPARGLLVRAWRRSRLNLAIDRQHLLRAVYEIVESPHPDQPAATINARADQGATRIDLLSRRSWSAGRLYRTIQRAQRDGYVESDRDSIRLTESGMNEAIRLTRQHRLWELYLITYADIAPGRVDREADRIEHVLEPEVISRLESLLARESSGIPSSPHELPLREHSLTSGSTVRGS